MEASVRIHVDASPEAVWSMVSDVTKIGRFSPETFEAEWVDGATGPAVGARFRGHVRRNGRRWLTYWSTCTVTECVPSRLFAFRVVLPNGRPGVEWRYALEPDGEGTGVTESFRLSTFHGSRLYASVAGGSRTRTNVENMRATLERIKFAVEQPKPL